VFTFFPLQTDDDEWEEDELGRAEQGISISQLLSEKRFKGWWFSCDKMLYLSFIEVLRIFFFHNLSYTFICRQYKNETRHDKNDKTKYLRVMKKRRIVKFLFQRLRYSDVKENANFANVARNLIKVDFKLT
jgi:hypothetical protein